MDPKVPSRQSALSHQWHQLLLWDHLVRLRLSVRLALSRQSLL